MTLSDPNNQVNIPAVKINELHKSFGDLMVLKGIDLEIEQGEVVCILGTSGSGKSTLLHILCGLEQPDTGIVIFKKQNITDLNSDQRSIFRNKEVGFVYQFHHLLSELSTLENIALPALLSGKSSDQAYLKSKELLDKLEIL